MGFNSGFHLALFLWITFGNITAVSTDCKQGVNCKLPECFCATFNHPSLNVSEIPQMVYFGFDDALTPLIDPLYKKLFRSDQTNPNGCPIGMTLYVSHQYTSYSDVKYFYDMGMEIASHSVHHDHTNTRYKLYTEAKNQRENLVKHGHIPRSEIIGWRSPFLETAGDVQPDVLRNLGYEYDISLTYSRGSMAKPNPWPFTADFGWPFTCQMKPCLSKSHPGFWEFPVNSMIDFRGQYPCNYLDGCLNRPESEEQAYQYLMKNFNSAYFGNKAPLGIHTHAAWILTPHNLRGLQRFINEILRREDVYILPVKKVLSWMKNPSPLSHIRNFSPWQCGKNKVTTSKRITPKPTTTSAITTTKPTTKQKTLKPKTRPTTLTAQKTRPTSPKPSNPMPTTTTTITTRKIPIQTVPLSTQRWKYASATLPSTTRENLKTTGSLNVHSNILGEMNIAHILTQHFQPRPTPEVHTDQHVTPYVTSGASRNIDWSWGPVDLIQSIGHKIMQVRPKLSASKMLKSGGKHCVQGETCHLPNCFCKNSQFSGGIHNNETPQFVYLTFDGDVDSQVFFKYRNMFSGKRRNPDNCPISSTFFVTQVGSRDVYLSYLHNISQEIALRGSSSAHISSLGELNEDINDQKTKLKNIGIETIGWRSPELKPLGDEQFTALQHHGLLYDSTLVLQDVSHDKQWPFTLDFGWNDVCVIPDCPRGQYRRLWEIPNIPVIDYKNMYPCNYVDGCMFSPRTAEETFQFLWNNFQRHYLSNKAPFGLNFRHIWFTHSAYRQNLKGFEMFLDKLSTMEDVYIVSIKKLLQWMRRPIPLSEMSTGTQC